MQLDPRLEESSSFICTLELCHVRLSHNAAFPWLLLIPQRDEIVEIIDLSLADQQLLMQEIALASQVLKTIFHPDKLNVATLGNMVSQLHLHIIARYKTDPAWPHPAWGTLSEYDGTERSRRINQLKEAFEAVFQRSQEPLKN